MLHPTSDKSGEYFQNLKSFTDTAFEEGKIEGKLEVAKGLKESGVSNDIIAITTGLTKGHLKTQLFLLKAPPIINMVLAAVFFI